MKNFDCCEEGRPAKNLRRRTSFGIDFTDSNRRQLLACHVDRFLVVFSPDRFVQINDDIKFFVVLVWMCDRCSRISPNTNAERDATFGT
jgi:hypothetical protein